LPTPRKRFENGPLWGTLDARAADLAIDGRASEPELACVTGAVVDLQPGFLLLDRRVTKEEGNRGNGTELLDRACVVATEQAR